MNNKTFKLMIKTHSVTGLRYLCMTSRQNWEKYSGSGVHWVRHLKKHGKLFTTELLYETHDYADFLEKATYFSDLYSVATNSAFANAIPEFGYGDQDKSNFSVWWETATDDEKMHVYEKRRNSLISNGNMWHQRADRENICQKISNAQSTLWNNLTEDEKRQKLQSVWDGSYRFMSAKDSDEFIAYRKTLSEASRKYWDNISSDELAEKGQKIAIGRLQMSDDAKKLRGDRVSIAFKTSEKRLKFNQDMKTKRIGVNNPYAKTCTWFGVEYTKEQFNRLRIDSGMSKQYVTDMFQTRTDCIDFVNTVRTKLSPSMTCPHCGKTNDPSKSTSAFLRWHMDNCRNRKSDENQIN